VEGHHPALEVLLLHQQLRDGHEGGTPKHLADQLDELRHLQDMGSTHHSTAQCSTPAELQDAQLQNIKW
jgi:hypothetical protein